MTSHGQIAYDAYRLNLSGEDPDNGNLIPAWDELTTVKQEAWEASGAAIQSVSNGAQHGIGYYDGWTACVKKYRIQELPAQSDASDSTLGGA